MAIICCVYSAQTGNYASNAAANHDCVGRMPRNMAQGDACLLPQPRLDVEGCANNVRRLWLRRWCVPLPRSRPTTWANNLLSSSAARKLIWNRVSRWPWLLGKVVCWRFSSAAGCWSQSASRRCVKVWSGLLCGFICASERTFECPTQLVIVSA